MFIQMAEALYNASVAAAINALNAVAAQLPGGNIPGLAVLPAVPANANPAQRQALDVAVRAAVPAGIAAHPAAQAAAGAGVVVPMPQMPFTPRACA